MPNPIDDRIARLRARKLELSTRLGALEAKAKEKARERDIRRKIVVGGAVLAAIEKDSFLALQIRTVLANQVDRPHDRDAIADLLVPSPAPAS